jgi:YidC/Oxa1 family membrane protein insertase
MLTSLLGQLGHPFEVATAWLLAALYALVPNYAVAIVLFTVIVMLVLAPLSTRALRVTRRLQGLAPELKRLRETHRPTPGMAVAERQQLLRDHQAAQRGLYAEHGVRPLAATAPLLAQFPILLVVYSTIRGLLHTVTTNGITRALPRYVSPHTHLYRAIVSGGGHLGAFGVNLADSLRSSGLSPAAHLPLAALVVVAVGLQYVQLRRAKGASGPAATPGSGLEQMLPLVMAVIYLSLPAALSIYFVVSGAFRLVQQELARRRPLTGP